MGRYSIQGSPQFDARVDDDIAAIVDRVTSIPNAEELLAIVLMGGYGRGEGTPLIKNGMEIPYNDYDFIVVSKEKNRLQQRELQRSLHALEGELSAAVGLPVDLALQPVNKLRSAESSLMNIEMIHGHHIVWGKADILSVMPPYQFEDLPLEEGTRLLMNRGALLLHVKSGFKHFHEEDQDPHFRGVKFMMKAHLAMGDCVLMLAERYVLRYSEKRRLIEEVSHPIIDAFPMVREWYQRAIDFKQCGDPSLYDGKQLLDDTLRVYRQFFLYFESERLHRSINSEKEYLSALESLQEPFSLWKVGKNLSLLGWKALKPSPKWIFKHPRQRVYAELVALLERRDGDYGRFFKLWEQLA